MGLLFYFQKKKWKFLSELPGCVALHLLQSNVLCFILKKKLMEVFVLIARLCCIYRLQSKG